MTRCAPPLLLLALFLLLPGLAFAQGARDVETQLGRVLDAYGSAELALVQGGLDELPQGKLARAYAGALLELGRGRERAAQRMVEVALRDEPESDEGAEDASLRASLLSLLLDLGAGQRGRQTLAGAQDPLTELAHAALLASEARCPEALSIVDRVRTRIPAIPESTLLLVRPLAACAREHEALALLQAEVEETSRTSDPRLAMAAGALLLRLGDHSSASMWCTLARENAGPLAPFRHRAATCAAVADAYRGLLPSARDAFLDAREGAMRDPALPLAERSKAGLSAAWALLSGSDPADARRGLDLIEELGVLRLPTTDDDALRLLRALALGRLERMLEAERELARVRVSTQREPLKAALKEVVTARLRAREGDDVAAEAAVTRAIDAAQRAGSPELSAEAQLVRARLATLSLDVDAVADAAVAALEVFPRGGILEASAYADPVLPRRALETAASLGWSARGEADGLVERRLLHAERARRAFRGNDPRVPAVETIDSLGRRLADRDAALVAYLVGETRIFVWLVEPGGVRMLELPSGSEVQDRLLPILAAPGGRYLGPSSWGERLLDNLLGGVASGSMLFVVPDGFLEGLPWSILGSGLERASGTGESVSLLPPAVLPSLGALLQAPAVSVMERGEQARVVFLGEETGWYRDPSLARTLERFAAADSVGLAGESAETLLSGLGRGSELLHLGLPVLAAGEIPETTAIFVPADGGLRRDPEALAVARLFQVGREHDVVVFASRDGWSHGPESLVRAAGQAIHSGARGALVVVLPKEGAPLDTWSVLYDALSRGARLADAVGLLIGDSGSEGVPFVQIVGDAGGRVLPQEPNPWPFYGTLGAGLLVLLVAIFRFARKRRDPFDVEPPEED